MKLADITRFVGPRGHTFAVAKKRRGEYEIEPFGFIERIDIVPHGRFLPNMDAANRYRLEVTLRSGDGKQIPIRVRVVCREVLAGRR